MKKNIFITGIGGCVGHYVYDQLQPDPDTHLYLLVRSPEKLRFPFKQHANVTLVPGDLRHAHTIPDASFLKQMNYVIHLAANWGDDTSVNDVRTLDLFSRLDPDRCQRVLYFSTASILDDHNQPIPKANLDGSAYVESKHRCYQRLAEVTIYPKIVTLFPTLIIGGDETHPYSHTLTDIPNLLRWLQLIRWLRFDMSFHFIHPYDIALITKHLLTAEPPSKNLVLGNDPAISLTTLTRAVCQIQGKKTYFQIPLSPAFIEGVIRLLRIKLSPWDRFCLQRRHFRHQVTSVETFGLTSPYQTIEGILANVLGKPVEHGEGSR